MGGPRSRDSRVLVSLRRFGFSRHLRDAPGQFELRQKRARSGAPLIVYLALEGLFSSLDNDKRKYEGCFLRHNVLQVFGAPFIRTEKYFVSI